MLILMGDLHGSFFPIKQLMKTIPINHPAAVLQLGDLGFAQGPLNQWPEPHFPVYALPGNHEDYRMLNELTEVTEVRKNLFYVPKGTILDLMGYRIGCVGGGYSIDRAYRNPGVSWFPEEAVKEEHIAPLMSADVDFIAAHSPPTTVIARNFAPLKAENWGLDPHWIDDSALVLEKLWREGPQVPWITGHMHRHVEDGTLTILDVAEIKILPMGPRQPAAEEAASVS